MSFRRFVLFFSIAVSALTCNLLLSQSTSESSDDGSPQAITSPDLDENSIFPQQRAEWLREHVAGATGKSPGALRLEALAHLDKMTAAEEGSAANASGPATPPKTPAFWYSIGPQPMLMRTLALSGRVDAIASDPRDSNVVYAGTDSGGVWKSIDGGSHWKPLTDSQPSLQVACLTVDPNNPDVIWVGTGGDEYGAGTDYFGIGLLRSVDGGATWTNPPGPWGTTDSLGSVFVHGIAIQPGNSNVLLVLALTPNVSGVYRSSDGGATWQLVINDPNAAPPIFDPNNGQIAYSYSEGAVLKSADGGATWAPISSPPVHASALKIVTSAANSSVLYTFGDNGVWKSSDAGAHWNLLRNPNVGDGLFKRTIQVSPVDPNVVFIGGLFPARSINGGTTWQFPINWHADYHAFEFSKDGQKIYIGNDGGIWSNSSASGPGMLNNVSPTWANLNGDLQTALMYPGVSVDDNDPNIAYVGTQDNGLLFYTGTPGWQSGICGDGAATAVGIQGVAYLSCTANLQPFIQHAPIFKVVNGINRGFSQNGIPNGELSAWVAPLVSDPSDRDRVYYGALHVYASTNAAANWTAISPGLPSTARSIAVAPSDPNTVYVAASNQLEITTNALSGAASTWTSTMPGSPQRIVSAVAVDPHQAQIAYALFEGFAGAPGDVNGHVFKTSDGGASWIDISGNLPNIPTNDLVVDPDLPNTVYLATDIGVFVTRNTGRTWHPLVHGLPRVMVTSLHLIPSVRILRAGTYGRGAWDLQLPKPGPTTLAR